MKMEIKDLAALMVQAAKEVCAEDVAPRTVEDAVKELESEPNVAAFFNEFGRLYAEATVPGCLEIETALAKAAKWDALGTITVIVGTPEQSQAAE